MLAKNVHIWVVLLGFFSTNLMGQVGINTTNPKAQLDIAISNMDSPENTDGILIPRINNFPSSNPGEDQHGMLVFLNTSEEGFPIGFYYWNNTETSWKPISYNAFSNFYKEGTSQPSNDINDAIFRNGNVRIGGEINKEVKLGVTIEAAEKNIKTGLEVLNENSATTRNTYSITTTNNSLTGAVKYGIKNTVSAAGEGVHYGIWNKVFQENNRDIYGIYNEVGETFGANQEHYGIYSVIGTEQGNGTVYGIYSTAFGTDDVYAGYFAGRLGIGKNPNQDYVFPAIRGAENQILISDNQGNLHWEYPSQKIYTSTGSATGNYLILPETYTLRINNNVTSIAIPDANVNRGRILVLVNWSANYKAFDFVPGDNIYDVTTNANIPGIEKDEVLTIQSAGNGWTLIGRMQAPEIP